MTTRTPSSKQTRETLVWVGPDGQVWPYLDETYVLVAGQRYQVDADFAEYLVKTHPDHWQRPAAPPVATPASVKE